MLIRNLNLISVQSWIYLRLSALKWCLQFNAYTSISSSRILLRVHLSPLPPQTSCKMIWFKALSLPGLPSIVRLTLEGTGFCPRTQNNDPETSALTMKPSRLHTEQAFCSKRFFLKQFTVRVGCSDSNNTRRGVVFCNCSRIRRANERGTLINISD